MEIEINTKKMKWLMLPIISIIIVTIVLLMFDGSTSVESTVNNILPAQTTEISVKPKIELYTSSNVLTYIQNISVGDTIVISSISDIPDISILTTKKYEEWDWNKLKNVPMNDYKITIYNDKKLYEYSLTVKDNKLKSVELLNIEEK